MFKKGEYYTRKEINLQLGGGIQDYLPHKDNQVVCACLDEKMNPDLPDIILAGHGEQVPKWARVFAAQAHFIPVFVKRGPSKWEYLGDYRVSKSSEEPREIARQEAISGRDDLEVILYLEKEPV